MDRHVKGVTAITRERNQDGLPTSGNEAAGLECPSHIIQLSKKMKPELQDVDVEGGVVGSSRHEKKAIPKEKTKTVEKVSMRAPAQQRSMNVQPA